MSVFVLIENWYMDSGENGLEVVGVYNTFEKVIKQFKKCMKQIKLDWKDIDTEEDSYVDHDMCWSIWEKDNYGFNHYNLKIVEQDIQ